MDGKCLICGANTGHRGKAAKKTCSRDCFHILNRKRFQELSLKNADNLKRKTRELIESKREVWEDLYKNTNLTIKEISNKCGDSLNVVRKHLSDIGLTKSHSKLKCSLRQKHDEKLSEVKKKLDDIDWVNSHIERGFGGKQFADFLGCSSDFVCGYLRSKGRPLVKRTESNCEIRLKDWLRSLGVEIESNNRKIIAPLELDIVIPSAKVAIELNGIYWHSQKTQTKKTYHKEKTDLCRIKGYDLIHIHDSDMNLPKIQSLLKTRLNIIEKKYFARKLKIVELKSKEYQKFCDDNHVQNSCNAKIKLGLVDKNNSIISVMSFSRSRFNKNYTWEMIRYCNLLNTSVVGGAQKLFSYFKKKFLKYDESVISYCDRRLFNGNVYSRLKFCHIYDTSPGYYWINDEGVIRSRYQTQKHKLNTELTETQYMESQKFFKIYDCGQSVFVYKYNHD